MMLINGEDKGEIAVTDRGFQYGDGLFETIKVIKSRPIFLEHHLQRLNTGCLKLNIPQPNAKQLIDEIKAVCKDSEQAVLKLIITRGSGGRGYRQPDPIQPIRVISLHPFPEYPSSNYQEGITARFCETRLGLNPTLAGIKHLNRLEQIMARAEWTDPAIQEGIMLDINNHVIEGTMTNLFYVKDGIIYTATLNLSGVAGIMRGIIMEIIVERNLKLIEHGYHKEELLSADEAFVCNSIIGLWPIRRLEQYVFSEHRLTKQIQQWLMDYKTQGLANVE